MTLGHTDLYGGHRGITLDARSKDEAKGCNRGLLATLYVKLDTTVLVMSDICAASPVAFLVVPLIVYLYLLRTINQN